MSKTLTDFLLARIAEDEAVAREDAEVTIWGKRPNLERSLYTWGNDYGGGFGITQARVLAECAAKRAIVEAHYSSRHDAGWNYPPGPRCGRCRDPHDDDPSAPPDWPCATLRAIAAIYADHPEFREEWR